MDKTEQLYENQKLEHYKSELDLHKENYIAQNQSDLELFKSIVTAGQAALKTTILINGGAAVALLAFIGKLYTTQSKELIPLLAVSLVCYVYGVLCGSLATGFTYLTQFLHLRKIPKLGATANILSNLCVIGSYILFAVGSWQAYQIFLK